MASEFQQTRVSEIKQDLELVTEETGDDNLGDVGSVGTARTAHPHHSEDFGGKGVDSWKG